MRRWPSGRLTKTIRCSLMTSPATLNSEQSFRWHAGGRRCNCTSVQPLFESSKCDKSGLKSGGHIRPGPDLKKRPDSGRAGYDIRCNPRKYLAKMWKNSKMRSQFAATLRRWTVGRSLLGRLGGRRSVGRVHSAVYNASAASTVARGGGHLLSEKSQRTQNGTMFVDLD